MQKIQSLLDQNFFLFLVLDIFLFHLLLKCFCSDQIAMSFSFVCLFVLMGIAQTSNFKICRSCSHSKLL